MENRRNYYRILQVQPGAPVEIIRASYRTLMQRLRAHPDLGGDHWNAALINEAYAVLTDAGKRAAYDRELHARVRDARHEARVGPTPEPDAGHCLFCHAPYPSRPNVHAQAACAVCGSPLRRPAAGPLAADGKRAIQRVPRDHPLVLYATWPQEPGIAARSRDVSPRGISFVTAELLKPRSILKLESDLCHAVVEVANLRVDRGEAEGCWLVGARFLAVRFPRTRGTFLSTKA